MNRRRVFNSVLIFIYICTIYNIINPILRFEIRTCNLLFVTVVMLIPILLLLQTSLLKNVVAKTCGRVVSGIFSLISLLIASIMIFNIFMITKDGKDHSFEWLREIQVDEYKIDTYRINGGAMTSYSILVRQEKNILPGIKLVKNVYLKNNKGDVNIEWDDHTITLDGMRVKLNPNIYN